VRNKTRTGLVSVVIIVGIIAVSAASHVHHTAGEQHSAAAAPAGTATASSAVAATGVSGTEYTLVQEPAAGFHPIYDLLDQAKHTIDMTMYELADPTAVQHLVAAKHRGVTVRVLLDKDFSGGRVNATDFHSLQAAGIDVRWAPAGFIFHQKTIAIDDTVAAVGTANLTARYYASSRDAWVIDRNPAHVAAIEGTFAADLASPSRPGTATQAPGLVWSPGAETAFVNTINTAKTTVDFQSEELKDHAVVTALAQAAKRGVTCRILMTRNTAWYAAFRQVTSAGCTVHVFPNNANTVYIHEKTVVTDRTHVIIGSQNAGSYSLTRNRELSLNLTGPAAQTLIPSVDSVYATDFAAATTWTR